jgi:hypothetical protein
VPKKLEVSIIASIISIPAIWARNEMISENSHLPSQQRHGKGSVIFTINPVRGIENNQLSCGKL